MPDDVGKEAIVFRGLEFKRRGEKYWHRCDAQLRRVASQGGAFVIPAACEAPVYLNISALVGIHEYYCSGCDRILTLQDLQNPRRVEIVKDGDRLRVLTVEKTPF